MILFLNFSGTYYEVPDCCSSRSFIVSRCIDINIFKGFRIIVQDSFLSIQLSYFSINVQLKIEFPLKYYLTSDYLLGVYLPQFPFVLFEICTIYFLQTLEDRNKYCPWCTASYKGSQRFHNHRESIFSEKVLVWTFSVIVKPSRTFV